MALALVRMDRGRFAVPPRMKQFRVDPVRAAWGLVGALVSGVWAYGLNRIDWPADLRWLTLVLGLWAAVGAYILLVDAVET